MDLVAIGESGLKGWRRTAAQPVRVDWNAVCSITASQFSLPGRCTFAAAASLKNGGGTIRIWIVDPSHS